MSESDIENEILDAAAAPRSSDHDGVQTQERDLRELIAADEYLEAKKASKKSKTFGLRFAKLVPPGAS